MKVTWWQRGCVLNWTQNKWTETETLLSPIHYPWSCERARWWTSPPCTSDWTQMLAHISSPVWCDSSHSRYLPQHAGLSEAIFPQLDHTPHSPQSWKGRPVPGFPGKTWRWGHRGWPGERGSVHSCTCDDRSPGMPEKSWPWSVSPCLKAWIRLGLLPLASLAGELYASVNT